MERNQVHIFEKWKVLSNESLEIILGKLKACPDRIRPPFPGIELFFQWNSCKSICFSKYGADSEQSFDAFCSSFDFGSATR